MTATPGVECRHGWHQLRLPNRSPHRFPRRAITEPGQLRADEQGASSEELRARIQAARRIQRERRHYNAELPPRLLRKVCRLDEAGERTLELAMRKLGLSARPHDRILKVACIIAYLAGD
ncbi:MAG: hypothetical protein ABSD56_00835 [Bryobacteraceae bacterium]